MIRSRLAALALFLILPAAVFARDIEITVEDEDIGMPLEGAVVIIRGGRQFICDEKGVAKVTLIDDKQTAVSVTYPGYETLRLTIPAAAGGAAIEKFKAAMRLGGVMTSHELVLEASRPETSETKSGRSVAISDRELERTAEIGIIEDVMNSVKLLPGVGYTGMFSAMPSIRGGDPGDLTAALDGFYLERPYHWMGSISIFDPKMVSSARLSHGVFSARYGHTISGLLEVTSKSPSPTETEIETAIGSSAASLNLSIPLFGKGGFLFMGKVTYWDTLIWAAKGLSKVVDNENLDLVNSISTAPYIRSAALAANYRFLPNLEWRVNGFFGSDGIGAEVKTDYSNFLDDDDVQGVMEMKADYNNYQGFLITGLNASPASKLALRFTSGVGFIRTITEDYIDNNVTAPYNEEFINLFDSATADFLRDKKTYTSPNVNAAIKLDSAVFNAQARADADIEIGKGFIAALGIQELYSRWTQITDVSLEFMEIPFTSVIDLLTGQGAFGEVLLAGMESSGMFPAMRIPHAALIQPKVFAGDVLNHGLTTSAYAVMEYTSPKGRIGTELGLRIDHLYFKGKGFSFQTKPALNPRFNIDFGILKNKGGLDALTATLGTGLFSSMNPLICFFDPGQFSNEFDKLLSSYDIKLNRSWTSVIGIRTDFLDKYSLNIEGYYKRIFDRSYITAEITTSGIIPRFNFDGVGNVWGFDLQLQKLESRYWDGWISYTFTWAKYMDPSGNGQGISNGSMETQGEHWYWPSFHRFHNANIVLNIKPLRWFNIGIRFGFASGQPRDKVSDEIYPYPVQLADGDFMPKLDEDGNPIIIQKYRRDSWYDEKERTSWSLPLDIKFSFFLPNRNGRANMEIYAAAENLLAPFYKPQGRTSFNEYTGRQDPEASSGTFDLPIPMVSFGLKWRY